mmetsp:Transcript_10156/g.19511  ORF Transcript_10156/g.19511 Transcript_10156/m.19511 type:complete len:340 (+) Transcript_10156:219-1238(+)
MFQVEFSISSQQLDIVVPKRSEAIHAVITVTVLVVLTCRCIFKVGYRRIRTVFQAIFLFFDKLRLGGALGVELKVSAVILSKAKALVIIGFELAKGITFAERGAFRGKQNAISREPQIVFICHDTGPNVVITDALVRFVGIKEAAGIAGLSALGQTFLNVKHETECLGRRGLGEETNLPLGKRFQFSNDTVGRLFRSSSSSSSRGHVVRISTWRITGLTWRNIIRTIVILMVLILIAGSIHHLVLATTTAAPNSDHRDNNRNNQNPNHDQSGQNCFPFVPWCNCRRCDGLVLFVIARRLILFSYLGGLRDVVINAGGRFFITHHSISFIPSIHRQREGS